MEDETTLQNGGEGVQDDIISEQKEEPDSKHEIAEEVEKCTTASAEGSKKEEESIKETETDTGIEKRVSPSEEKELSGSTSMREEEEVPEGEHRVGEEGKTEPSEDVTEEQTTREETTEKVTEKKETHQVTSSEFSHLETSVESSEPVQIVDEKSAPPPETLDEATAPHVNSSELQEKDTNNASDDSKVKERSAEQNQDEQDQNRIEESEKIVEPSIKAQLNDIIKEIDEVVAGEDDTTVEEEGQGQVHHTWRPKGKYDITPTPVTIEEVVPITVADVPEPEPFVPQVQAGQKGADPHAGEEETLQEPIRHITVPQLLPNGELGSPIEIPEGIPLLARILPKEEGANRDKIPLERLFTPATDSGDITPRKKKTFASSDFYAPNHPTIDDQLQLAQKISGSLVDQHNKTSKGQAMYERRKQRSVKWIHQEGGQAVQKQEFHEEEQAQGSEFVEDQPTPKSKPTMKLVMNPRGVQDHTTVEQHYQELLEQSHHVTSSSSSSVLSPTQMPASPEIVKDIMTDMQSPTGKGAALFAKRKKRMDKFIVDETNVQKTSAYQQQQGFVQNSSVEQKSVVNQFSSSSSSFSSSSTGVQQQQQASAGPPSAPGNKKKWLKEKDQEQQRIMEEFLKNREAQYKLVKTSWEAVLETGNTSAAFQRTEQTKSSFSSSLSSLSSSTAVATPPWLEMPKPVPVTAPLPQAAPSAAPHPTPPSLFARPATEVINNESAGHTGLMYTAEVKVLPPTVHPSTSNFQPRAAAAAVAPTLYEPAPPLACSGGMEGLTPAEQEQRRRSANFNLAATGWGTYNTYYRPTSFAS